MLLSLPLGHFSAPSPLRFLLALAVGVVALAQAQPAVAQPVSGQFFNATPLPPVLDGDTRWGFNHVYPDATLQQKAREAGARWNRWEFRWDTIQPTSGPEQWAPIDQVVDASLAHGLSVEAILISVPAWAREPSFLPRGLYLSWNDPNNLWGRFVRDTVTRYKDKIRYWEAWNEPDNREVFWPGSTADYYQLLKVTYLSVKSIDPGATVLIGGLTYWDDPNFLDNILTLMQRDPTARANSYYFDDLVWHQYSRPTDILDRVTWSRARLNATIGPKGVWLNETNVPAWDESAYNNYHPYQWAATAYEQASYVIQAFAYGVATNTERVFVYRFHDVGEAQAWGMVRGDGTYRPAYPAFQVAAEYLSNPTNVTLQGDSTTERIVVDRGPERVTVLWNKTSQARTVRVSASTSAAIVVDQTGAQRSITPSGGAYSLALAPATANNGNDASDYIIGGPPLLLVESSTLVSVDSPGAGSQVAGQVLVSGWASDPAALTGTGVDAVHVYLDGPSSVGTFLGAAAYGDSRPDVASVLGSDRFRNTGWHFTWNASQLRLGDVHTLYVYAHSAASLGWAVVTRAVRVGYGPDPLIGIESPAAGSTVSGTVAINGWAIDRNAASGPGVDLVHVYLEPYPQGAFLGAANYGAARPDVASFFSSSEFTGSGWSFSWDSRAASAGAHTLVLYAHSAVTDRWTESRLSIAVGALDGPLLGVDVPTADAQVGGNVSVAGWSIDRTAASGTGVDSVQVYLDGPSSSGTFLGTPTYGGSRPDVGSFFGSSRFTPSGWVLTWDASRLRQGDRHTLYIYAHSTVTGGFTEVRRTFTVGYPSDPSLSIDTPVVSSRVSGSVQVVGWAIDRNAREGTGVDAVDVYVDGPYPQGSFLAHASYGSARGDVASAFGSDRFTASGWSLTWNTAGLASGTHTLYVYARSSSSGEWKLATRQVVV